VQIIDAQLTGRRQRALFVAVQLSRSSVGEGRTKDRREDTREAALLSRAEGHQTLPALTQIAQEPQAILT
jgi:hypothetical protein